MDVKLNVLLLVFVLFAMINARRVKSKPDGPEDVYGDLLETGDEEGVQNDDHDDYDDYADNGTPDENNDTVKNYEISAEFRTKPQVFVAHIGETVFLPCEVSNPDAVVLVWRKNEKQLLYQGEAAIHDFKNMKRHPNGTLEVTLRSDNDFDQYRCQMLISQTNSPEIVHTVVQPTAARIVAIHTADNKTIYNEGDTLKLTCVTAGYPKAKVSWHRGNERLGVTGESIIIESLEFKTHTGHYRCLAENGIGNPAHSSIEINIEHEPVIKIEKYFVNSDQEHDAELKCTVRAYPQAVVVWKKNGMNIREDKPKITLKKRGGNVENILVITNLTDSDFGEYTCSGTNSLGKVQEKVSLVKIPAVPEFMKHEKANRDVVLSWKVESKSRINKHQLQYRKLGDPNWQELYPEVTDSEKDVYTVKYALKGLEPGSYETRVRSQNPHGWSEYSDVTQFEGILAKNGSHHKQHNKKHHKEKNMKEKQGTTTPPTPDHQKEETIVGESQTGGSVCAASSASLLSIALLILFSNRQ